MSGQWPNHFSSLSLSLFYISLHTRGSNTWLDELLPPIRAAYQVDVATAYCSCFTVADILSIFSLVWLQIIISSLGYRSIISNKVNFGLFLAINGPDTPQHVASPLLALDIEGGDAINSSSLRGRVWMGASSSSGLKGSSATIVHACLAAAPNRLK